MDVMDGLAMDARWTACVIERIAHDRLCHCPCRRHCRRLSHGRLQRLRPAVLAVISGDLPNDHPRHRLCPRRRYRRPRGCRLGAVVRVREPLACLGLFLPLPHGSEKPLIDESGRLNNDRRFGWLHILAARRP
jgi:hypothetical protein